MTVLCAGGAVEYRNKWNHRAMKDVLYHLKTHQLVVFGTNPLKQFIWTFVSAVSTTKQLEQLFP